ncbi:MAG: hypothetical protein WAN50_01865 [Minisyncoccia bacterium]
MANRFGRTISGSNGVQRSRGSHQKSKRLVPIIVDGTPAFVDPNDVSNWTNYSGTTTSGISVHSIVAATIGGSVLITKEGAPVLSVSKDELNVFMTQFGADTATSIKH